MRRAFLLIFILMSIAFLMGVNSCSQTEQEEKDAAKVDEQQGQYAKGQPLPFFDWSLERHLVIQLYSLRNKKVATHAVWRSDYGMVEGDCPSMGFGIPYDTSLTNPWKGQYFGNGGVATIGQAEPNGVFASTNTAATWVMCVGDAGAIEPVYVESKVTIYPGPVHVDYATNRVTRTGAATVRIAKE